MNVVVSRADIVHDGTIFDPQSDSYVDTYSVVLGHTAVISRARLNDAWYAVDRLNALLQELKDGSK